MSTQEQRDAEHAAAWTAVNGAPEALQKAIRTFTVDAPDGQPNGPAERAMIDLQEALDPERHPKGLCMRDLRVANGIAARLLSALAGDTRALRLAAEAFFGGDFRKPTPEGS